MRGYGGMLEGARLVEGTEVAFEGRESGGEALRAVDLALRSRLGGVQLAGYVGLDVLGGTRWIIDVTGRKLRIDE